ncbi:MAG: hypothetical protein IPH94_21345 [Saprospiraceae bacterium]|nr:hypothetical protein [Saprospiraceae bacterium]MBK7223745.1 hypothetical protein [Saprospiraceae bacterium]MBK7787886.1 hypothetical protein [Saprospiraceae bacterium]MBK8109049.1 hypothetical protein [Saprospiraceae bacterium]MBK8849942.1 hypothetical protein [Saprospiraceae bacterium]
MHDIEPYYRWRDYYIASDDKHSPFYGRVYSELHYTEKIYNYYIHPQWDFFGSPTMYMKLLFVDYEEGYAIMEFIGEWNDCITNDIMYLKRDVADVLIEKGISKFILLCDNVLNFHGSDDCYYEEWWDDIKEAGGWVCMVNTFDHVSDEMKRTRLQYYTNFGLVFNDVEWHRKLPEMLFQEISNRLSLGIRYLE